MITHNPIACETETCLLAVPTDHRHSKFSITNDYGNMQTNESILYNGSHVDSPTTPQLKGLANS